MIIHKRTKTKTKPIREVEAKIPNISEVAIKIPKIREAGAITGIDPHMTRIITTMTHIRVITVTTPTKGTKIRVITITTPIKGTVIRVTKTKISMALTPIMVIEEGTTPIVEVSAHAMMFVSLAPCLIIISTTFYLSPCTFRVRTRLWRWKGQRMAPRVRVFKLIPF